MCLSQSEFGFVKFFVSEDNRKKNTLHGFVLCRSEGVVSPTYPKGVIVDLVCSRPRTKTRRLLMECAEKEAKTRGYDYMRLFCLPDAWLKAIYESLGYFKSSDVPDYDPSSTSNKDGVKAYVMTKRLVQ